MVEGSSNNSGGTQRVTMADVAEASGVSAATVSLALRNRPGISEETRQRVREAAEMLGYRYKASPSTLPGQPLQSVGLVVKSESGTSPEMNPFYSYILTGIEDACRQQKINLLYATLPVDENNRAIEIPRLLQEASTDGLMVVGAYVDRVLERTLRQVCLPIVLVDGYATSDRYDAVLSDNFRGAVRIVKYLIERGHRHIGMVGGYPHAYPSLSERRRGYLDALGRHDSAHHYFADCSLNAEDVFEATTQLLRRAPQITALFGCNDETALAAMQAARALGRRLPEDLSVVGFDDITLARHVTPSLTTMHVDKAAMGRLAVQLLSHRISYPDSAVATTLLRPQLVERHSVRSLSPDRETP